MLTGLLLAAGLLLPKPSHANLCALELYNAHGVWLSAKNFAPFYRELEVTAYLSTVGRRVARRRGMLEPIAVLPVFSRDPIASTWNGRILISTGLLLDVGNEQELEKLIDAQLARMPAAAARCPALASDCAWLVPELSVQLGAVQEKLARQVARYEAWTRPQLKARQPALAAAGQ